MVHVDVVDCSTLMILTGSAEIQIASYAFSTYSSTMRDC
jgi:hypothetical protein